MSLKEQIHEAISVAFNKAGLSCSFCRRVDDLIERIDALPAFTPVAAKEWPDAEGLWVRDGKLFQSLARGSWFAVRNTANFELYYPDYPGLHGDWILATLLVPPLAPKPKFTQEAWAFVDSTGRLCGIVTSNVVSLGSGYTVVRIPPTPIEEET